MKVYRAEYILRRQITGVFRFEQLEGDYMDTRDGYLEHDGLSGEELIDITTTRIPFCHVACEKYFDRQLTKEELDVLEREMKLECIEALTRKKKVMVASLDRQIGYIEKQLR